MDQGGNQLLGQKSIKKKGGKGAVELSHTSAWCLGVTMLVFLTGVKRS